MPAEIVGLYGDPLIDADRLTVPGFLKKHGYYFGVDVPNWPPYCFIENDRTVGIPSEFLPARLVGDNLASFSGPAMLDDY